MIRVEYRAVVPYRRMAALLRADLEAFIEKTHVDLVEFFQKHPNALRKAEISHDDLAKIKKMELSFITAEYHDTAELPDGRVEVTFTVGFDDRFKRLNDKLRKAAFGLGKVVFPSVKDIARDIADTIRHDYQGVVEYAIKS